MDADFICELFSEFGSVDVRRMFGGSGIYADGVMFGLIADGTIYLKADAGSAVDFEREGCSAFSYKTKSGRRTVMSYWRLPDRLYDDPQELARWARRACAAASAARAKPPSRRRAR